MDKSTRIYLNMDEDVRVKYDFNDPAIWKTMPREDFDKLIDEGVNVQGPSGQPYKFKSVRNPFTEARRRKFKSND